MATSKKRGKFNFLKFIVVLLSLYVLCYAAYKLINLPIKHIRILNTTYLKDQSIIKTAKIDNYPSFFLTTSSSIKKNLRSNPYIKDVIVDKKWFCRLFIYVNEYRILFYDWNNKLVLENGQAMDSDSSIDAARLIDYVPDTIYKNLIKKMNKTDNDILLKISEIEYRPNDVDKERFLLTMNDGNYVYLTLYTFDKLNKYDDILPTLEKKKGILYLDSGNYFEIIN